MKFLPAMRRATAATATLLTAAAATSAVPAAASAGEIVLKTTYAAPIAASNPLCTAEPRALVYGTTNFNPAQPLSHRSHGFPLISLYTAANAPSSLDLIRATEAGGRSDLCFGFTLPPDVEPALERDWYNDAPRLQDLPPWPDLVGTHVAANAAGTVATDGDDLRDLSITLPAGYAMSFGATPQCSGAAFAANSYAASSCPAASRVGDAFVRISALVATGAKHATATGLALYNLAAGPGELGRLGLSVQADESLAPAKFQLAVRFAADGSGRLVAELAAAPRSTYDTAALGKPGDHWGPETLAADDPRLGTPKPGAAVRTLYTEGLSIRSWGSKANHATLAADFGSVGSRCDAPLSATLAATTYAGATSSQTSGSFQLADCSSLPLAASASASTDSASAGAPTGATVQVSLPQDGPRAPALASELAIALPDGVELGSQLASGADGQPLCSPDQFGATSLATPTACPASTAIGQATFTTTATALPFTGNLYLTSTTDPDALAGIGVDLALATGDAGAEPRLKVSGGLYAEDDGRLTIALDDLPDVRLAGISVSLRGGPNALLTNPRTCGTHAGTVTLERAAGEATRAPFSIETTADCDVPAQSPSLSAQPTTAGAGSRPATSLTLSRADRSAAMQHADLTLPPGLLLAPAAIPSCSDDAVETGSCSAAAQLGTVRLTAGSGDGTTSFTGQLFRAGAPDGALAGGVIVAEARLGDLDLGSLIAPVRFDQVGDARLALSATLPTRVNGVAIDLRSLSVDLDRDGAIRQPTACGALPVSATVSGDGQSATTASAVSYPACAAAPFAPGFNASATGDAKADGHPKATFTVTPRAGDAALSSAAVTFPAGLRLDAKRVKTTCAAAQWTAGRCPANTRIGTAGATLSVTRDTLAGDAFLVASPGDLLPAVGIVLDGTYGTQLLGRVSTASGGRLTVRFGDLPDLPVTAFGIQLDGGTGGVVQNTTATACAKTNGWGADLRGQGGQSVSRLTPTGCGGAAASTESPVVALSLSGKTGLKMKINGFGDKQLQAVKLTLPKAMRINTPKAKRKGNTAIALIGATAKPAFTSGSLTLKIKGTPTEVVERLRIEAFTLAGDGAKPQSAKSTKPKGKAARAAAGKVKKTNFILRMAFADGSVQTRTIPVKLP